MVVAAVPWESGKRFLFSIFSMASFCHLLIRTDDALLHLDLESAVPHPSLLFENKLSKGGWARGNPAHCEVIAGLATIKPRAVYLETVVDKRVSECSIS